MKSYNRLMILIIVGFAVAIVLFNLTHAVRRDANDRLHNVEINRLMERLSSGEPVDSISTSEYERVTAVEYLPLSASHDETQRFFTGDQYVIRPVFQGDSLTGHYKFTYISAPDTGRYLLWQNLVLLILFAGVLAMLLYIRRQIIRPMSVFSQLPAALAKGDFTTPVRAQKERFFGRFLWGLDMLRQTMSQERQRALALEKEKSETALALSHDIKTPLGAILLSSKALREGLYTEPEKQKELLQKIDDRAHEIEGLVAAIQRSVSEEMLELPVNNEEFYLNNLIQRVDGAYRWQMEHTGTEFIIDEHSNCLMRGDYNRTFEAICNLIENAMKYGDGKRITISFPREENCQLISVTNTGNTLPEAETVRLFESFWRGSNSDGKPGNGLGLFIARQLAVKMGGDAYATHRGDEIEVTLVLRMV